MPNIIMSPPQVYMCSPSWTLLPPPSPYHPSGSSQCISPKHPVSGCLGSWAEIKTQEHTKATDPLAFPPSYCSYCFLPWYLFLLIPLSTSLWFPSMTFYLLLLPLFVTSRPLTGTTSACHWFPHSHPVVSFPSTVDLLPGIHHPGTHQSSYISKSKLLFLYLFSFCLLF